MIPQLANLSDAETQLIQDAIPMITVLIAGADGNIETDETEWGAKITKIRSYDAHETMQSLYEEIGKTFNSKVSSLISSLPSGTYGRTEAITAELSKLNDILPNLEPAFAKRYYDGLVTFAEHVAKSSGGFMGFASISKAEKDLIGLPMINPIVIDEDA